jgi:hypothetical protein
MKKLLFLAASVALLAAACNSGTNYSADTNTTATTKSESKLNAAVNDLNASIDSEESVSTQSDDDVINSDQSINSSVEGVSNANY